MKGGSFLPFGVYLPESIQNPEQPFMGLRPRKPTRPVIVLGRCSITLFSNLRNLTAFVVYD
jgi:hypothetical protein